MWPGHGPACHLLESTAEWAGSSSRSPLVPSRLVIASSAFGPLSSPLVTAQSARTLPGRTRNGLAWPAWRVPQAQSGLGDVSRASRQYPWHLTDRQSRPPLVCRRRLTGRQSRRPSIHRITRRAGCQWRRPGVSTHGGSQAFSRANGQYPPAAVAWYLSLCWYENYPRSCTKFPPVLGFNFFPVFLPTGWGRIFFRKSQIYPPFKTPETLPNPVFHTIPTPVFIPFLPPFFIPLRFSCHSYPRFFTSILPPIFYHQPRFLQQSVNVARPCPQCKILIITVLFLIKLEVVGSSRCSAGVS